MVSTPIVSNGRFGGEIDCNNPIGAPDIGLLNWQTRQEATYAFTLLQIFGPPKSTLDFEQCFGISEMPTCRSVMARSEDVSAHY